MRKREVVYYGYNDISHVGEYRGRYHPYGNMVYFKKEDGETLYWNTILSPNRVSQVEKHTNEKVEISYDLLGNDELGRMHISHVRFLRTIEKLD